MKKLTAKTVVPALATTTILTGIVGISYKVAYELTHPKRSPISATPDTADLYYDDIEVVTNDDVTIRGWFLPAQKDGESIGSQQTLIFAHHYGGSRSSDELGTLPFFRQFLTKGYNVIAFDFRNSGLSTGDRTTMGVEEQSDLQAIVEYCNIRIPTGKIVLWGFSMGAAVSLNIGWSIDNVVGVIADSSYNDLSTYCLEALKNWAPVNPTIFSYPVLAMSRYVFGIESEQMSPVDAISKYQDKSVLLIHSHKDALIPVHHATDLYRASNPDWCELYILPSENHARAYWDHKEAYLEKVYNHLDKSFNN